MISWPASKVPFNFRRVERLACMVWVLSVLFLSLLAPAPSRAESTITATSVTTLFRAYAAMPGLEASFHEEKHLALLAMPLSSRGKIFFARPHFLLREVDSPAKSSILVTPQSVRMRDDDGDKTIDLRAQKEIRPFIQSLLWILSGNLIAIEKAYRVTFEPFEQTKWRLTLEPKSKSLARLIKCLKITGQSLAVVGIEVEESNGNRTVTTIDHANPKRSFSPQELKRLFNVQPTPKPD